MANEQGVTGTNLGGDASAHTTGTPASVQLPAPTVWPFALAFGLALAFAGLLTSASVSALGAALSVVASVGWFLQVLPREQHEAVRPAAEVAPIVTERRAVARLAIVSEMNRARIPVEIYPITAGVKGGLAGSAAMALLAALYGVISHGSIWYPINLLAAVVYAQPFELSLEQLTSFHPALLLVATLLHLITSLLVGLLYGVMLPMFPRRPILLGGFIAPIMWTGLLHSTLGIVNPLLNQRINWTWFVVSQIGFGVVAGLVVVRQERVRTRQHLAFAVRAGIEAPGVMDEKSGRSDEK